MNNSKKSESVPKTSVESVVTKVDVQPSSCALESRKNTTEQIAVSHSPVSGSCVKLEFSESTGVISIEKEDKIQDSQDQTPQNALLKQLLQNSQPPHISKRMSEDLTPDNTSNNNLLGDATSSDLNSNNDKHQILEEPGTSGIECDGTDKVFEDKRLILEMRRMQELGDMGVKGRKKQGQNKRQKQIKNKDCPQLKKRPRKSSGTNKPEEDYDSYMETMMVQLRTLQPLRILEPDIRPNFNVCSVFGSGNLNPGECDKKLKGCFGRAVVNNHPDYYTTYPFGSNPPTPPSSLPPTPPPHRGFYNQEFPSQYCVPNPDQRFTVGPDPRKQIEVPSSLPTPPPHLDQKSGRELDSPDTVLSSSSPECVFFESSPKFPGLRLINDEASTREECKSISPAIPLLAPIPIRARPKIDSIKDRYYCDMDDEDPLLKNKENQVIGVEHRLDKDPLLKSKFGIVPAVPLKESGNIAVTLTLTSAAAEDISGVLVAFAGLLKIPVPLSFEIIERTSTPPSQKLGLYGKGKDVNIHSIINGKPRFCRHCDVVVLSAGIRKKLNELPYLPKDEQEEDEVTFCSTNCYMQFAITHRSTVVEEKEAATIVDHPSGSLSVRNKSEKDNEVCTANLPKEPPVLDAPSKLTVLKKEPVKEIEEKLDEKTHESNSDVQHKQSIEENTESVKNIKISSSTSLTSLSSTDTTTEMKSPTESSKNSSFTNASIVSNVVIPSPVTPAVTSVSTISTASNLLKSRKHSSTSTSTSSIEETTECSVKRSKGQRWRLWTATLIPLKKYKAINEDEINMMLDRLDICVRPEKMPADTRCCVLCHDVGDGMTNGPARLLNMDVDKWVHLNCALWSAEVYETVNGALMNVELAVKRGLLLECTVCHLKGATLGCFRMRCTNIYHFSCAMKEKCMFFKDKTLLCPLHIPKQLTPELKENELPSLTVYRRVYVNRDENRQVARIMQQGDHSFLLRIGSLIFLSVGQLLPHQLQNFHSSNCIYPVNYKIIRMYWSMRYLGKRCQYLCCIQDIDGRAHFKIEVKERGHENIILKDISPKAVWQQVLDPIEKKRHVANAIKVFPAFITGEDLFGLSEPTILRVIESLPGVETLNDYNFKYGRSPLLDLPLAINPTGCARTEQKMRAPCKSRPHTLHTKSSSRSSFQATITGLEATCPYTKQFVHSKSSQYRRMKVEWRNNVYLARSRIQGLGLYAAREIEKHTMVIEYIGQLIRNEVSETREKMYEAQNRGIYMFRLDDSRVIDATLSGGLARYVNHSCNPNCVAELVQIDRDNRIIIFANRRIQRGEELTYDYKFDIEDDQHKIPCLCGAPNCKKWMN